MSADAYDDQLRKMPLGYKVPCPGCVYLEPVSADHSRCGYELPEPYRSWLQLGARKEWRFTSKELNGPFAADANVYHCSMRKVSP